MSIKQAFLQKILSYSSIFYFSGVLPLHVVCNSAADGTSQLSYGNHFQRPETGHIQVISSVKATLKIFRELDSRHLTTEVGLHRVLLSMA